ncbi:hypothetical protein ACFWG0_13900 [Streptomyces yangpuensis]|uniref:hypothetical protein n=1 Tax=Streptomyces yangpuensis TaxID=1648182 RepID=UPI00364A8F66
MAVTKWTTTGVFTGHGGVLLGEGGTLVGELTVRTTWASEQADIAVQYVGASEWHALAGSPVLCPSPEAGRSVHQSAVDAVRTGGPVPFEPWPIPAPGPPHADQTEAHATP